MSWSRNIPEAPIKLQESLWFWFWPDGGKEPIVMELWPERKFSKNLKGWWFSIPLEKPIEKIPVKSQQTKNIHTPIIILNI